MNEMRYSDCIYFEWCKEKRGLGCQGCSNYAWDDTPAEDMDDLHQERDDGEQ